MIRVAAKKGRKNSGPLKTWVMVGGEDGEEPEFGEWLTPTAARKLAARLSVAADKADGGSRASLLPDAIALWKEWRDTDITEDDDRWSGFTDRVYALLKKAGHP